MCFREGNLRILAANGTIYCFELYLSCISQASGRSAVIWLSVEVIIPNMLFIVCICSLGTEGGSKANSSAEKRK